MKRNFRVEKEIELHVGQEWFDLKNVYFFAELDLNAASGRMRLIFECHPESGRDELIGKRVSISFDEITHFEFSRFFVPKINTEMLRIGFKTPLDSDTDWLLSDKQSDQDDHLLFCLGNDEFIRVYARIATLEKL